MNEEKHEEKYEEGPEKRPSIWIHKAVLIAFLGIIVSMGFLVRTGDKESPKGSTTEEVFKQAPVKVERKAWNKKVPISATYADLLYFESNKDKFEIAKDIQSKGPVEVYEDKDKEELVFLIQTGRKKGNIPLLNGTVLDKKGNLDIGFEWMKSKEDKTPDRTVIILPSKVTSEDKQLKDVKVKEVKLVNISE